jgi:protein involved in sex pheromone biosynthesis
MRPINVLGIALLALIVILIVCRQTNEGYEDIKVDPKLMKMAQEITKPKNDAGEANESFRKVLVFIENNPEGATDWLDFIRTNLFAADAKFKSNLSFKGISERWRPIFKDAKDL